MPAVAVDGLQERESLGPTGVGHGIALPHARLEGLDRIVGVFVRLERRWISTASTASRWI
jgi:nitrogen PTS system EIIA component